MKGLKWLLLAAIFFGLASAQKNIFFPGSASYVSSPLSVQAQNSPSIPNRIPTKSAASPKPDEERRVMDVPKPGEAPLSRPGVQPLDFIPSTQFSTPPPLNDFFGARPQFFSAFNRPGIFGQSPFGLNDFNLQPLPSFNSGPDLSIFSTGDSQPKSFHFRREFNDKDGYTPWVDAGPKRPPSGAAGHSADAGQQQQLPDSSFHNRYDLGPDGFFDFSKDKKNSVAGSSGFGGKTQAIMKIEPKTSQSTKNKAAEGGNEYQDRFQQLGNNNFNNFPSSLAQNFRSLKWPGQN